MMTDKKDMEEILIVEDSPTQAARLKYVLEQHGYRVATAQNGRDAINLLARQQPHLIISDILMPGMDGYQLCRFIRSDADLKGIPVILLTALSDPGDVMKALECGADNFIIKPYAEHHLIERVRLFLDNRDLRPGEGAEAGQEIIFQGQRYWVNADRLQILNLLLSTYEAAVERNSQLLKAQKKLESQAEALEAQSEELRVQNEELSVLAEGLQVSESLSRRQARILAGINRIFHEALICESEEKLGETCLAVAEELTGSKFAFLAELNQAGNLDASAISYLGWEACKIPGTEELVLPQNFRIHGLYAICLKEGRSAIVNDPATHPESIGTPPGHPPIKAFLGVPLKRGRQIMGMIGLGNKEGGYTDADREAVEALAPVMVEALMGKRGEEALVRAKNEWERTFNAVPDLIAIIDKNYRIVRVNRTMADALGTTPEELAGRFCHEIMHNSSGPPPFCPHARMLDDGRQHITEVHELGRDFLVSASPLTDEQGRLLGSVHVARDITARKMAEQALQRAHDELELRVQERTGQLKQTVTQLQEEVALRLFSNRVLEIVNRHGELPELMREIVAEIKDFSHCEAVGVRILDEEGNIPYHGYIGFSKDFFEMESPLSIKSDRCMCINVVKGTTDPKLSFYTPGGSFYMNATTRFLATVSEEDKGATRNVCNATGYESVALVPIRVGNEILGLIHAADKREDMVPLEMVELLESVALQVGAALNRVRAQEAIRKAEGEVKKLNEELEQRVQERTAELEFANRELESFSYSVSHDLKAPIRAIQGFSRILVGEYAARLDEEGRRLLDVIINNTQIMDGLINDLLALSRLGRHQVRKSFIDLAALARQIFEQERSQEPDRDLQLTVQDLPQAWGDPSLIKQVMMNLLDNAIKYTRAKKPAVIEVGGYTEGGQTVYYVKDNGVGFDERYAHKLFGVFQRLHAGAEYEGTGVGLAIVQRIVQRHGGRVWAEGKVAGGATFYFSLPQTGE